MNSVTVFSPAKLNLFLAVTGRRADGFHDLLSLVAPVNWGDELSVERGAAAGPGEFTLTCTDPDVPVDESNLVLRAARAFRAATGWKEGARFSLGKRIPMCAGLGGGSSNAVAALRALNTLAGGPLGPGAMAELAGGLGSDCALFLQEGPAILRGRGERVEPVAAAVAAGRLSGRKVLIFKPGFGAATAWAYARIAKRGAKSYLPAAEAEARLAGWLGDAGAPLPTLLFNHLEEVVFEKFLALPVLLEQLRCRFGLAPRLTGSGSACFAFLDDQAPPVTTLAAAIREAWGPSALVVATALR